jgi:hypothetical protein
MGSGYLVIGWLSRPPKNFTAIADDKLPKTYVAAESVLGVDFAAN